MSTTTEKKHNLRTKILTDRLSLSKKEIKRKSELVIKNLSSLKDFKISKNVMIYYPFKNEVDVLKLIDIFKNKNFYFPVVNLKKKTLEVKPYTIKFLKNKFGIPEPKTEKTLDAKKLDFIVVPGVVFDTKGNRIGYGGGYYDRFLKNLKCKKCGVCFDFQIVNFLPKTKNDIKLDYIISEKRIIKIN